MKRLWFSCLLIMPLLVAAPQETAPPGFEHWTAASLKTLTQALSTEAAADPHRFAVNQLKDFPSENFILVHREADGQPELHET